MKILLIWDEYGSVPIRLYEATGNAAKHLIKCHGQYINLQNATDAIDKFGDVIYDADGNWKDRPDIVAVEPKDATGPYDRVVICGFAP